MAASDSSKILESIKAALGLQPDYDPFDTELIMHINSVLAEVNQLGVGPEDGLVIDANTPWSTLLTDSRLENVKSFVFLRVKMLFDLATMPQPVIAALEKQIEEAQFRISVASDPMIPQVIDDLDLEDDEELIFEAGGA